MIFLSRLFSSSSNFRRLASSLWKAHGIEPAPERKRTGSWETFIKAHWHVMASIDFTTVEVWTKGGLTTFYLLFVMELKMRRSPLRGLHHQSE